MRLVSELRRRNVFRMAALYAISAWLVMQVVEVVTGLANLPDWIGPTTLVLLGIGFPIALILSWVYELTPEGISLEKDVDPADSTTRVTGRRLDFIVISVLCAALILFAYDKWWISDPPAQSIAVLPFENMSADPEQEYFSDGLSEEILNLLARIPALKVIGRTSSFAFKGKYEDIRVIGQTLGVRTVLEGSVRKSGDRIRITAQLIDALDGAHIWSETYDRTLTDIFAVQDSVAAAIIDALEIHIVADREAESRTGVSSTRVDARSTRDIESYDIYLLGRYHSHLRTVESINRSIELFKEAIEANPDFVLPYAGLADAYNLLTAYGNMSGPRAAELMQPIVQKALELDESLAEVYTSLGAIKENLGDLEGAEEAYNHAIDLNNNYALAHMWLGNILMSRSRLPEAQEAYARARQLDPLNSAVNLNLARTHLSQGRFDEGMKYIEGALEFGRGNVGAYQQKAYWLTEYGQFREATEWALQVEELAPGGAQGLGTLAYSYLLLGDFDQAEKWLDRAAEFAPDNWSVVWNTSQYYLFTGKYDALDTYIQDRLQKAEIGDTQSSRDLKSIYLWAGLAKLKLNENDTAADYFDLGYENSEYLFEADQELRFMGWRALAHQRAGNSDSADRLVAAAASFADTARLQGWATPSFLAQSAAIHVLQGDDAQALTQLELAIDAGFRNFLALETDPVWTRLQTDSRFQRLVAR